MANLNWTRRDFLKTTGLFAGAGLLQPVLPLIAAGKTIERAYPDEVLSIEKYTKGKIRPGMIISRENAGLIRDIAPQGLFVELSRGNTEIRIAETTRDPRALTPDYWLEATLRNKGLGMLDKRGQVWTKDGRPWIGGSPFPEPKSALEAVWNYVLNVGRVDDVFIPSNDISIDTHGKITRHTTDLFIQLTVNGRLVVDPKLVVPDYRDELFRTWLMFTSPFDEEGLQVATTVYYDNTRLPDTDLYVPDLKRTRRVTSTQRFEPAAPYEVYFVTDLDIQNDPLLTWSWKLIERKPMLAPSPANRGRFAKQVTPESFVFLMGDEKCPKFPRSTWELRPEMFVVEGVPHLEGASYGRKRMYVDGIYGLVQTADIWDIPGRLWKFIVNFYGNTGLPDHAGGTAIGQTGLVFADLLQDYHSNIYIAPEQPNGKWTANTGLRIEDWMTPAAMLERSMR
jgi:Protein of unknown function (DUF1329)